MVCCISYCKSSKNSKLSPLQLLRDWSQYHLPDKSSLRLVFVFTVFIQHLEFSIISVASKKGGSPKGWNLMEIQQCKDGTKSGVVWSQLLIAHKSQCSDPSLESTSLLPSAPHALPLWSISQSPGRIHSTRPMGWLKSLWRDLCSDVGRVELTCQGTPTRWPEGSEEGTVTNTRWELWPWRGSPDRSCAWRQANWATVRQMWSREGL